ncbi:MAG: hypothetical protein WDN69_30530 [Aliidongia sp.]
MAPPLAALAGIAVVHLRARAGRAAWLLPLAFAATAAWQVYIEAPYIGPGSAENWRFWLFVLLLGGSLLAVLGLAATIGFRWDGTVRHLLRRSAITLALLALLATPTAWALSTVIGQGNNVSAPAATIALFAPATELTDLRPRFGAMREVPPAKLLPFLEAHRQDETYLLATANSWLAAPLIITSGQAVMAMGGFTGRNPILTPEELADLVGKNQLRYVLLTEPDLIDRAFNAQIVQAPLADWVRTHGKPVDPAEWRGPVEPATPTTPRRRGGGFAQAQLYDLRPAPIS